MNDHNKEQQLRYLEEVCIPLHRAGFETQPLDESQLPVHWNGAPLCRITGKGSVFYRREDVDGSSTRWLHITTGGSSMSSAAAVRSL